MRQLPVGRIATCLSILVLIGTAVELGASSPEGNSAQGIASPGERSPSSPYARIAERPPQYEGPGRGPEADIRSKEITIGLLVPLKGVQTEAGRALQLAAALALEETNAQENHRGRPFRLQTRSTSGLWGKATSEVVRLIYADQVVALVTSTDGATAHLAEQVANKAGVPVLSLAPDSTITEINLAWIFRCVPSDRKQAAILAREIYARRGFTKVAVVSQGNRDGRRGALAFRTAAGKPDGLVTLQVAREPTASDLQLLVHMLRREQVEALVLWTEAAAAARIATQLRDSGFSIEIYLSVQATQPPFFALSGKSAWGVHILAPVESANTAAARERFVARYKAQTGTAPNPVAIAAFNAVRLLARALDTVGPNRARLRDYLATDLPDSVATREMAFDLEGNLRGAWTIRTYQPGKDACCPEAKKQLESPR